MGDSLAIRFIQRLSTTSTPACYPLHSLTAIHLLLLVATSVTSSSETIQAMQTSYHGTSTTHPQQTVSHHHTPPPIITPPPPTHELDSRPRNLISFTCFSPKHFPSETLHLARASVILVLRPPSPAGRRRAWTYEGGP